MEIGKKLDKLEEELRNKGLSEAESLKAIADIMGMNKDNAYESGKRFMRDYSIFAAGDVGSRSALCSDIFDDEF